MGLGTERFKKNLRIGVRFDGETLRLLDGTPILPALLKDCVAELLVSPDSVTDAKLAKILLAEMSVPFLDQGAELMVGVGPNMIGAFQEGLVLARDLGLASRYAFVPVKLESPLCLRVRGDQEARLCDCPCSIPTLKMVATSLNHAFILISETYETKRKSHSASVFERVMARSKFGKWLSLDEHRLAAIRRTVAESHNPEVDALGQTTFQFLHLNTAEG